MDRNNLFPVFLKLEFLETLIVGGGHVGLEKLTAILKNSPTAKVTLVARTIQEPIKELAKTHPSVKLQERNFKLWDLWDKDLVLLATDSRSLHETIRNFARSRRLLVNVADLQDVGAAPPSPLPDGYIGLGEYKENLDFLSGIYRISFAL